MRKLLACLYMHQAVKQFLTFPHSYFFLLMLIDLSSLMRQGIISLYLYKDKILWGKEGCESPFENKASSKKRRNRLKHEDTIISLHISKYKSNNISFSTGNLKSKPDTIKSFFEDCIKGSFKIHLTLKTLPSPHIKLKAPRTKRFSLANLNSFSKSSIASMHKACPSWWSTMI